MTDQNAKNEKLGFLNLLVMLLSIYILVAVLIETFYKLSPEMSKLLADIDLGICAIFFIDFSIRFKKAENKLEFMKWAG